VFGHQRVGVGGVQDSAGDREAQLGQQPHGPGPSPRPAHDVGPGRGPWPRRGLGTGEDGGQARRRILPHCRFDPEDGGDEVPGDDRRGSAVRHDASPIQRVDPIAVRRGQIQVVEHREHGLALLPGQPPDQPQQAHHVREIEVGRRFVEHQDRRVLCQRLGEDDSLALATRQAPHEAIAQVLDVGLAHGLTDAGPILAPGTAPWRTMGRPPQQDHLQDGEFEGGSHILGHDGHSPGRLPGRTAVRVLARHAHDPGPGPEPPRRDANDRGLPRSVRTDEADHLSRFDPHAHPVEHGAGSVPRDHVPKDQATDRPGARLRPKHRPTFVPGEGDKGRTGPRGRP
jgi:hypothetical protein